VFGVPCDRWFRVVFGVVDHGWTMRGEIRHHGHAGGLRGGGELRLHRRGPRTKLEVVEELIPPSVGNAALHNRLNALGYPNGPLHERLLKGETVPSPSQK
jgi:hypothetical protein